MKYLRALITTVALCCISLGGEQQGVIRYQAYHGAENDPVLKTLESVTLRNVNIRDKTLAQAIREINRAKTKDGERRVINMIIRYPRQKGGQPGSEATIKYRTILVVKEINFASAVDILCDQVGYHWSIVKNPDTGVPSLLLKYNPGSRKGMERDD